MVKFSSFTDNIEVDPDLLRRRRNLYNKQVKEAKKDPTRLKRRAKAKAARKARKR